MSNEPSASSRTAASGPMRWPGSDGTGLVFFVWCLRREAPRWPIPLVRLTVLIPVILTWCLSAAIWPRLRHPGGWEAIRELFFMTSVIIGAGGIQYCARAVCWELSMEMRDLVRLTGINARTLLWATTLSRWWTLGWSVLLILPIWAFAFTLGGVSYDRLVAGAYGLALVAALTGGFGMLVSVLTSNSKNPEKSASNNTGLILVLYNLSFVLLSLSILAGYWVFAGDVSTDVDRWCRRISYFSPAVSVSSALSSPFLFNPSDPGYWFHFLPAIGCAVVATLAIEGRLRSDSRDFDRSNLEPAETVQPQTIPDDPVRRRAPRNAITPPDSTSASGTEGKLLTDPELVTRPASGRRRRCSDRPFLWKDIYVLSDESKRVNLWTLLHLTSMIGILLLNFFSPDNDPITRSTLVAVFTVIGAAIIVSVRFDGLLTIEFRERTWGSLMLLPVDPCELLRAKLVSTLWEQRFVALPLFAAAVALVVQVSWIAIIVAAMATTIACIFGGLLCQVSCINQFLGKVWWVGPCQAIGFVAVAIASVGIWVSCGQWLGFFLTALLLGGILLLLQFRCVNPLARNWVET